MPCDFPRLSYRLDDGTISFRPKLAPQGSPLPLPCKQCRGCRLDRAREWAIRCVHEASLYENSCFITLTYSPDDLPYLGSLQKKDFQNFLKRWRQHNVREARKKLGFKMRQRLKPHQRAALRHATGVLRYYYCGEYGEQLSRPHFHAIIFGQTFADKTLWKKHRDHPIYRSETLEKLWTKGHSSIGTVTFESAGYVARYVTKKITGANAPDHYERLNEYGEYIQIQPEYTDMSKKPGIAANWFKKFSADVYPSDEVILRGKKLRPPKYYDKLFDISCPDEMDEVKFRRLQNAKRNPENNTPERRHARMVIRDTKTESLKRNFEK